MMIHTQQPQHLSASAILRKCSSHVTMSENFVSCCCNISLVPKSSSSNYNCTETSRTASTEKVKKHKNQNSGCGHGSKTNSLLQDPYTRGPGNAGGFEHWACPSSSSSTNWFLFPIQPYLYRSSLCQVNNNIKTLNNQFRLYYICIMTHLEWNEPLLAAGACPLLPQFSNSPMCQSYLIKQYIKQCFSWSPSASAAASAESSTTPMNIPLLSSSFTLNHQPMGVKQNRWILVHNS